MEFKIDATLYLKAEKDDNIEELIHRIYILIDPNIDIQLYEDTAELRSV